MKKFLVILISVILTIMFFASLVSCGGPKLSEKEAKEILQKELGYPQETQINILIPARDDSIISSLLSKGDLAPTTRNDYTWKRYDPTEKGKAYIKSEVVTGAGRIGFRCVVAQKDIKVIKEILIDEKNNTARVTYTLCSKPYEPYYSSFYLKSFQYRDNVYGALTSDEVQTTDLKKYDKGWRIYKP
jgi:hypothetical protein